MRKTSNAQHSTSNIQWKRRAGTMGCWMLSVGCWVFSPLHAAEPALLVEARQARAESIPQVAIQKLRVLLKDPQLPEDTQRAANRELAASLLDTGETEEALWLIQLLADGGNAETRMLEADIFTRAGRWAEALPIYTALLGDSTLAERAQLGAIECHQALGQTSSAIEALDKFSAAHPEDVGVKLRLASLLVDVKKTARAREILSQSRPRNSAEGKWARYVEGRILLASDQPAPAMAFFEELLQDLNGVSESLLFGATLGSMEARAILNGYETADGVLEKFISRYYNSPYLEQAFQRLDEVYEQEEHPAENELKKWAGRAPVRRSALAQFYLAKMYRRVKKPEKAAGTFESFVQTFPAHALGPAARMMQADAFLAQDNLAAAVRVLEAGMRHAKSDEERAQLELRTALVHYRQGEALLAGNSFRRAAKLSEKLRPNAYFDAALADLSLRNYDLFFEDYRTFSEVYPNHPRKSELLLEEGFTQARSNDPRGGDTLELFLHHFPKHPRQNEARIALAELSLQDGDAAAAAKGIRTVLAASPDNETAERASYLAVFAAGAEKPANPSKVIVLARDFIQNFKGSSYLPEVRMTLGQLYFQTGDHANAETQFTLLARENPNSPYAETALFLAGQAATKWLDTGAVDRALRFFVEVVDRDGPLKLYARQQQAIVYSQLGKEEQAITLYDAILTAQPPPDAELQAAALCGKADNLGLLGRKDPKQLEAAMAVYETLAALPKVSSAWRNQALYKKGRTLDQLDRRPEALTAYYDVLDKNTGEDREFFWYYKAGFAAAQLFEKQENWKSAIGIYQKMARLEGPRAAEAKGSMNQLRLEKFIWD